MLFALANILLPHSAKSQRSCYALLSATFFKNPLLFFIARIKQSSFCTSYKPKLLWLIKNNKLLEDQDCFLFNFLLSENHGNGLCIHCLF